MLVGSKKNLKQKQYSEFEHSISDEQKWEDIAEEEFEVSSNYSPMDNYSPEFLKTN